MVERDLDDTLRAERLPGEVLAPVPAARRPRQALTACVGRPRIRPFGPLLPGMPFDGVHAERRELVDEGRTARPVERRGDPDVMEAALVVVEAEQERADVRARAVLVPPEAGHDAVRRALVLELEHRPLARLVLRVEPFRDHAVESGSLEAVEPVDGRGAVAR